MTVNLHRLGLKIIAGLVILGGFLTVLQIWGVDLLSWDIFLKAIGTLGVIIVVLGFLLVMKSDLAEHKKLKDDNYLD